MGEKLGKLDRLRTRDDISRVFRDGRGVSCGALRVLSLANALGRRRLGVAVATRHGSAVRRNRLKRLCREAFRACRAELPDGRDYVMLPRPGAEHTFDGLCRALRSLAQRLGREDKA